MVIDEKATQITTASICAIKADSSKFAMKIQLPGHEGTRIPSPTSNQVSCIAPDLLTTRAHAWNQARVARHGGMNTSSDIFDTDRSQGQVHNDLLDSREKYLHSETVTEDWAHQHTNQHYSRQITQPAKPVVPDKSKICGPNPYEVGSKEWMEEFDKRMGFPVPALPDRPKYQEVRGEPYMDWYARHGSKTEWDTLGFRMVEPIFASGNREDNPLPESNEAGWLLNQYLKENNLRAGMREPDALGLSESEVAQNEVEDENPFPYVDMSAINEWLEQRDNYQSGD